MSNMTKVGLEMDAIAFAAAAVGSAGAVSLLYKAPFMDVLMSVNGGLGAAAGYTAGAYLATKIGGKTKPASMAVQSAIAFAGAVALPGLVSGTWDSELLVLAAGAFIAPYATFMILNKVGSK